MQENSTRDGFVSLRMFVKAEKQWKLRTTNPSESSSTGTLRTIRTNSWIVDSITRSAIIVNVTLSTIPQLKFTIEIFILKLYSQDCGACTIGCDNLIRLNVALIFVSDRNNRQECFIIIKWNCKISHQISNRLLYFIRTARRWYAKTVAWRKKAIKILPVCDLRYGDCRPKQLPTFENTNPITCNTFNRLYVRGIG